MNQPAPIPAPAPPVTAETEPFWAATAESRLVLTRCDECGTVIWYPRLLCPECAGTRISWVEASGRGTVYSFTITRRGEGAYRESTPYVLAYVELEEGPRLLTNIVGCDPETVSVGQAVEVVYPQEPEAAGGCGPGIADSFPRPQPQTVGVRESGGTPPACCSCRRRASRCWWRPALRWVWWVQGS